VRKSAAVDLTLLSLVTISRLTPASPIHPTVTHPPTPSPPKQDTVATISRIQRDRGVTDTSLLNFVVSDGTTMVATRFVSPEGGTAATLYYAEGEGGGWVDGWMGGGCTPPVGFGKKNHPHSPALKPNPNAPSAKKGSTFARQLELPFARTSSVAHTPTAAAGTSPTATTAAIAAVAGVGSLPNGSPRSPVSGGDDEGGPAAAAGACHAISGASVCVCPLICNTLKAHNN
jgi:hypothetical protein